MKNQINTIGIAKALRDSGIVSPSDRRAFMEGKDLRAKIMWILENHPQLQEELAYHMGIGDSIIENLHEIMGKDFQEPDTLLHELIKFFQIHAKMDLKIYDTTNGTVCSPQANGGENWVHCTDIPFLSLQERKPIQEKGPINERRVLRTENTDLHRAIESSDGGLCFKITTPGWINLVLSFGNRDTPKNEVAKIQKLLKKTWLLQRIKEKLRYIQTKYTDHLTGLYNKHYIQSTIEKNVSYSVIFLDLDKFKEYNDTYGHDAWDILLQEIAKILQTSTRNNDKVCRNGWDEFIIFIDRCDSHEEIDNITKRIQEKVDNFNSMKQKTADIDSEDFSPLSITSWYAIWDDRHTLEDAIRKADKEMFKRKIEKWNEGGFYRIIDMASKLSRKQQKEIVRILLAANPNLSSTDKDQYILPEIQ